MNLRTKSIAVLTTALLAMSAGLYYSVRSLLMEEFQKLETREAKTNAERLRNAILDQHEVLLTKAQDWAAWDDSYRFVQDNNKQFRHDNFLPGTLPNLKINLMVFVNLQGRIVAALQHDLIRDVPTDASPYVLKYLLESTEFTRHKDTHDFHQGILDTPDGPIILVSKPMIKSNFEGPIGGTLVLGVYLNSALLERLSQNIKLSIQLIPHGDPIYEHFTGRSVSEVTDDLSHFLMVSPQMMKVFTHFPDAQGGKGFVFKVDLDRFIMMQGRRAIDLLIVIVVGVSVGFSLLILLTIERTVIRRVIRLARNAEDISRRQDEANDFLDDGSDDEIGHLAISVNLMLETLYERRRSLRNIVDNVTFGFLICDRQFQILPGYTKSCHKLFESKDLSNKHLPDVLKLDARQRANIEFYYQEAFESQMPGDFYLSQLPQKLTLGDKTLRIEGRPIYSESDHKMTGVLFSVIDVSHLEEVEAEIRENRTVLMAIRNKSAFAILIGDFQQNLAAMRHAIVTDQPEELKAPLHTLKGTLGTFGFVKISHMIHLIEEKNVIELADIRQLEEEFNQFIHDHQSILNIDEQGKPLVQYEINESQMSRLEQVANITTSVNELQHRVLHWVDQVRRIPIDQLLGPIEIMVEDTAHRYRKRINFEMIGTDIKINPQTLGAFASCLPHLLRNAIYHGLENPEKRGSKSEVGQLTLKFAITESNLVITIDDDGQGIDIAAIQKKSGVPPDPTKGSSNQFAVIFEAGFSTAETVDEVAGRGVGLAAVASTVQTMGGTIEVTSQKGEGTRFVVTLPLNSKVGLSRISDAA